MSFKLQIENLEVSSFETEPSRATVDPSIRAAAIGNPFCCTGCVSGCGINPTASGCDSGGGGQFTVMEPAFKAAAF